MFTILLNIYLYIIYYIYISIFYFTIEICQHSRSVEKRFPVKVFFDLILRNIRQFRVECFDLNNAFEVYKLKKYSHNQKIFYHYAFIVNLKNEVLTIKNRYIFISYFNDRKYNILYFILQFLKNL